MVFTIRKENKFTFISIISEDNKICRGTDEFIQTKIAHFFLLAFENRLTFEQGWPSSFYTKITFLRRLEGKLLVEASQSFLDYLAGYPKHNFGLCLQASVQV